MKGRWLVELYRLVCLAVCGGVCSLSIFMCTCVSMRERVICVCVDVLLFPCIRVLIQQPHAALHHFLGKLPCFLLFDAC